MFVPRSGKYMMSKYSYVLKVILCMYLATQIDGHGQLYSDIMEVRPMFAASGKLSNTPATYPSVIAAGF